VRFPWLVLAGCGRIGFGSLGGGDAAGDGAHDAVAVPGNYAFVTSMTRTPGQIAGLTGGDAWCNELAAAAPLPGTYVAWLSGMGVDAEARVRSTGARGWWRPDGMPFADTIDDIVASNVLYPPRLDELGRDVATPFQLDIATGTTAAGADLAGFDCEGFTSSAAGATTVSGVVDGGSRAWTDAASVSCGIATRIYCLGVDRVAAAVAMPPDGARHAFITGPVPITTGLAAIDARCAADAASAGLAGAFAAWLPTSTGSASSRFTAGAPWVRRDGVVAIAGDLSAQLSAIDQDASGNYQTGLGWSGAATPTTLPGSANDTCLDWSSAAGTLITATGDVSRGELAKSFGGNMKVPCTNMLYVYCLER
jgi:hypothetical protein